MIRGKILSYKGTSKNLLPLICTVSSAVILHNKSLKYVSIPADLLYNLPTKSTAHLNDIRFLELPISKICTIIVISLFITLT